MFSKNKWKLGTINENSTNNTKTMNKENTNINNNNNINKNNDNKENEFKKSDRYFDVPDVPVSSIKMVGHGNMLMVTDQIGWFVCLFVRLFVFCSFFFFIFKMGCCEYFLGKFIEKKKKEFLF